MFYDSYNSNINFNNNNNAKIDNVPSTASLSSNLLLRSKSYDTKLNMNSDDAPVYVGYDSIFANKSTKDDLTLNNNNDDNEQTKIIVTSFAPTPNDRSRSNFYSAQVRPSSHYAFANNNDANNNSNSPSGKADSLDGNYNRNLSLLWPDGKSNLPVILFCPKVLRKTYWECKKIGGR